MGLLLM